MNTYRIEAIAYVDADNAEDALDEAFTTGTMRSQAVATELDE